MKRTALAFAALLIFGLLVIPAFGECTEADIHNAVAQWANVPPEQVTDTTGLDGLGGRFWPDGAPELIQVITQLCGCSIPVETYQTFEYVDDIDEFVGVDDLDD